MSIQTWGDMNKSQIDSTLIETRITEMIQEHNDDPTAHMADDQSIGLHRINDVIDHPAGSVLGDKATATEIDTKTTFETLTGWTTTGAVTIYGYPGIDIASEDENSNFAQATVWTNYQKESSAFNWTKDTLLETILNEGNWNDDYFFYFGWLKYTSPTSIKGIGFKIVDNVIYGFLGNGTTTKFTSLIAGGVHYMVNLRVMWNATTKTASFYINGELAETLTDVTVSGYATNTQIYYQLDDPNEVGVDFHVQQFHSTISLT